MNRFDEVLGRLKACLNVWRDQEVARHLCFSASAFSERKRRNSFPEKELIALAQRRPELAIDVNYVLTGRPYPAAPAAAPPARAAWGCRCVRNGDTRRDHIRRLCVVMLDDNRPGFMGYDDLLTDVQQYYPDATRAELLRALDYQELAGLLTITQVHGRPDQVRLTCEGIDLADGYDDLLDGGHATGKPAGDGFDAHGFRLDAKVIGDGYVPRPAAVPGHEDSAAHSAAAQTQPPHVQTLSPATNQTDGGHQ